jgi:hypothetical protein
VQITSLVPSGDNRHRIRPVKKLFSKILHKKADEISYRACEILFDR